MCEESVRIESVVSSMDGVLAISVCEESEKDKLDVALKILRTLQAVGRGCFVEYWDVPTAKRRYDYGTVREMREQVGSFQCLFEIAFRVPVLRCDAAGGGEGAGIRAYFRKVSFPKAKESGLPCFPSVWK